MNAIYLDPRTPQIPDLPVPTKSPAVQIGALSYYPADVQRLDGPAVSLHAKSAAELERRRAGRDDAEVRARLLEEQEQAEAAFAAATEFGLLLVVAQATLEQLLRSPMPGHEPRPVGSCPTVSVPLAEGRLEVRAPDLGSAQSVLWTAARVAHRRYRKALERRLEAEPHTQGLLVAPEVQAELEANLQDEIDALAKQFTEVAAEPLERLLLVDCMLAMPELFPPQRVLLLPRVRRNTYFRLLPWRVSLLARATPMRLGTAWSWLWWLFVFVLPDGSR
jgi:hypothetical protein